MRLVFSVAVLAAAPLAHAGVEIRPSEGGRLTLRVDAAPLSDVLDRLAKQTGMKVIYDGAPPRQIVTATLENRTPAEAVLGMLEGQGLNFAIAMDRTGNRVETLMMAGAGAPAAGASSFPQPTPRPMQPRPAPPAASEAEPEEIPPDEPVDEETPPDEGRPLPGGVADQAELAGAGAGAPDDPTEPGVKAHGQGPASPFGTQSINPPPFQPFMPPGIQPPGYQPPSAGAPEPQPTPPPKEQQEQ
jgi:hypothetical protein